jgi:hypothetical protein
MDPLSQELTGVVTGEPVESSRSAVSWAAIVAGAFAAAAISLVLAGLGSGLGLASVSPWPNSGASATTFTFMTAIWFVVVQWVASGLGGYLTGRLRTKWVGTHTHEVFFRDTAHGFVTWAVATLLVAAFLTTAVSSIVGNRVQAAATAAGGAAQGAAMHGPTGSAVHRASGPDSMDAPSSVEASGFTGPSIAPYDVDMLFRSPHVESNATMADARAETTRILAKGATAGDVPAADRAYLAELVSARTGITKEEARKRADDVIAEVQASVLKARQAADAARKAAAKASILTALSMLVGAFIACVAAALGGHRRDIHP